MPFWLTSEAAAAPAAASSGGEVVGDAVSGEEDPAARPLKVATLSLFFSLAVLFLGLYTLAVPLSDRQSVAQPNPGQHGAAVAAAHAWADLAAAVGSDDADSLTIESAFLARRSPRTVAQAVRTWRRAAPGMRLTISLPGEALSAPSVQALIDHGGAEVWVTPAHDDTIAISRYPTHPLASAPETPR